MHQRALAQLERSGEDDGDDRRADADQRPRHPEVAAERVVEQCQRAEQQEGRRDQPQRRKQRAHQPAPARAEEVGGVGNHRARDAARHADEVEHLRLRHLAAPIHELFLHLRDDAPPAAEGEPADSEKPPVQRPRLPQRPLPVPLRRIHPITRFLKSIRRQIL